MFNSMSEVLTTSNETKKNNVALGLLGSILFSLIGVAAWMLIGYFGYIASFAGFLISFFGIYGYAKLGGKLNGTGIILTIIVTIVMVFVAQYLTYCLVAYKEFKEVGMTLNPFSAFSTVLAFDEVKSEFIKYLIMGYVFTAIGSFSTYKKLM